MRNFHKQNANLKHSPLFSIFLQNAGQLFSGVPRHLTHGINIRLKMGKEPGQIAEFLNYGITFRNEKFEQQNGYYCAEKGTRIYDELWIGCT